MGLLLSCDVGVLLLKECGLLLGVALVDAVAVVCAVEAVQCGIKWKTTLLLLVLVQAHGVVAG